MPLEPNEGASFGFAENGTISPLGAKGMEFKMRVGIGYDVHKLVNNRDLIIGGVKIPHDKGLLGHSDADVLLHAIADALLGAAALGDIGLLFPDNEDKYKDADSLNLLRKVADYLKEKGYSIVNIDSVIVTQSPKMRPFIDEMRANIAAACCVNITDVSVKATTEEGLGFTGTLEGVAAKAIALIKQH